jgi:hypothetical protein
MPIYKCEKCNKEFIKKSAYTSHIIRLNPCVKDLIPVINDCSYCKKIFSNKYILKSHLNICKKKVIELDNNNVKELKKKLEEQEKILEEKQKELEEQQKKIEELTEQTETNKNVTINNNNSTNTTNNININIVGLGLENMKDLTPQERGIVCTSGYDFQVKYMQMVHCNKKLPQYNNIEYTNERHNRGRIKINNEWRSLLMDDFINTLVPHIRKKVIEMYDLNEFPENIKQRSLELTKDYVLGKETFTNKTPKIKGVLYDYSKNKVNT